MQRVRLALLCGAVGLAGCATYSDQLRSAHRAASAGDWAAAETRLNRVLGVASRAELPEVWTSESALALLERGLVLQAQRAWAQSARDLSAAETELEFIDLKLDTPGKIGKYVYSDSAEEYRASPVERTSLNAFNMMNYLAMSDLQGAAVEARRYQVMRSYLESLEDHPRERFGAYLAGFVFEHLGEPSRALRYYEDALEDGPLASLDAAVARTAASTSWRGPEVTRALKRIGGSRAAALPAEVLVVLSVGRTPIKVPKRIPLGAAIGIAGSYVTGDLRVLQHSVFKVVVYPELEAVPGEIRGGRVRIDGSDLEPELLTDLAEEVRVEYDELKPRIIAAALTRMIARAAAAEGARLLGQRAGREAGEVVGVLAGLGTEAALVGLDRPDTRSWTFLPGKVFVVRRAVEPGRHSVEVQLTGRDGELEEHSVEVRPGGFAAVIVSEPR